MITKRLMALIALASSAALAQSPQKPGDGNLPAPDLFDSQIVCTSVLPTAPPTPSMVAMGAMESVLDQAIGMGTVTITQSTYLNDLGYVIPTERANCGQGTRALAFTATNQGSVATDVAEGYIALVPKFEAVYGDPDRAASTGTAGALQQAQSALERAQADDNTSAAVLATLRRTLENAQEADTKARAELDAIAAGPIYQGPAWRSGWPSPP